MNPAITSILDKCCRKRNSSDQVIIRGIITDSIVYGSHIIVLNDRQVVLNLHILSIIDGEPIGKGFDQGTRSLDIWFAGIKKGCGHNVRSKEAFETGQVGTVDGSLETLQVLLDRFVDVVAVDGTGLVIAGAV